MPGALAAAAAVDHLAGAHVQHRRAIGAPGSRREAQLGHRRDARECLTAESEGPDPGDVARRCDLRRRVTLDCEVEIVGLDPGAVVDHRDADEAAALDADVDPRCARIQRVLDELLDNGGRSLDHLSRRDRIGDNLGQAADRSGG